MNILVTGGSGFIGSALCHALVKNGHKVWIIDDLSSGFLFNLDSIFNEIIFYREKVENFDFTKLSNIEIVIHLAAQVSVPTSVESFGESSSSNLLGTIKILDFCRSNALPLVYASSSAIYGDLAFGDDHSTEVDLLSPYACDKYVMELYAHIVHTLYGISSIGLRFFNVYGPRQSAKNSYAGVIPIFIDQIFKKKDLRINGGFQTRDFIFVDDVVFAFLQSMRLVQKKTVCEQVNILTGESISIDRLADILIGLMGSKVKKIFRELQVGDPIKSVGGVDKMVNLLDMPLNKMVNINDGLTRTIEFTCKQGK